MNLPDKIRTLVITLSDRASKGEYKDKSGPLIIEILEEHIKDKGKFEYIIDYKLIPDNEEELLNLLDKCKNEYNIIITTGGTGIGPRDKTVDIVKSFNFKEIPGIMEVIRVKYGIQKPNAMLSRSVAGIIGQSLIYTLPGSTKAVKEYMQEILKTMEHLVYMQYGVDVHHKK